MRERAVGQGNKDKCSSEDEMQLHGQYNDVLMVKAFKYVQLLYIKDINGPFNHGSNMTLLNMFVLFS